MSEVTDAVERIESAFTAHAEKQGQRFEALQKQAADLAERVEAAEARQNQPSLVREQQPQVPYRKFQTKTGETAFELLVELEGAVQEA